MTCPACGIQNADGAAFCANCGTAMNSGSVATATADLGATAAPSQHSGGGAEPASDELLEMTRKELGGDYNIEKELGRGGEGGCDKKIQRGARRRRYGGRLQRRRARPRARGRHQSGPARERECRPGGGAIPSRSAARRLA